MSTAVRKLYSRLKYQRINTLVYDFDVRAQSLPVVTTADNIEIVISAQGTTTLFTAKVHQAIANKSYLYKSNLLARQLGYKDYPLIGGCHTNEAFRGRNIYPYVLTRIIDWYRVHGTKDRVYIFVDPTNKPSVKGIEKAGFRFVRHVSVYRLLGLCIYKQNHDS